MEDDGVIPFSSADTDAMVRSLRERARHHRAVRACIKGLLPCLPDDPASSRLVAALAMLEVGASDGNNVKVGPQPCESQTAMQAISTADACWALCSEKRLLIIDDLLPSVLGKGRWSWQELRRTGLVWWLSGGGDTAQADTVVARLAQFATSQLRSASSQNRVELNSERAVKRLADETVFWCVLQGAKMARLRALAKTGVLNAEPALARLLEHPHCADTQFLRKNAFRLVSLHRFHLAAALFVLCGSHEEAAQIVLGRLQDMQLLLLLTRHCPEVAAPLLRSCLNELRLTARLDAWLHFLLLWHVGDREAAFKLQFSSRASANTCGFADEQVTIPMFDGVLRLCACVEGFEEMSQTLLHLNSGLR